MPRASKVTTSLLVVVVALLGGRPVQAMRPVESREQADYVVSGVVTAVYGRETTGYREYVIEIIVEQVEKGTGIKKGDTFRAFCYQRKKGKGGLEFDTAGHKTVPKEGQRVKAFVNRAGGRNEGAYPDWIDIIRGTQE
jgi:hypothetical protein